MTNNTNRGGLRRFLTLAPVEDDGSLRVIAASRYLPPGSNVLAYRGAILRSLDIVEDVRRKAVVAALVEIEFANENGSRRRTVRASVGAILLEDVRDLVGLGVAVAFLHPDEAVR